MSGEAFEIEKQITAGKDERLAIPHLSVQGASYLDDKKTPLMPKPAQAMRNMYKDWQDVRPKNSDLRFGQNVTFNFGNEGFSQIYDAELLFELPALGDSAAGNLHPDDALYAGAGTSIDWIDFVGERLIGNEDNPMRFQHANETLREISSDSLHMKRLLCQDNEGRSTRAAYQNAVGGGNQDSAQESRFFSLPLWLPWGTDEPKLDCTLAAHAFANEFVLTFKLPTLAELINTDLPIAQVVERTTGDRAQPLSIILRLTYITPEKAERAAIANLYLNDPGVTFEVQQIEREQRFELNNTQIGAQTVDIKLFNAENPIAYTVVTCRFADDLLGVGETPSFNDNTALVPKLAPDIRVDAGTLRVGRPQPFRLCPVSSWEWVDGGKRLVQSQSRNYWKNSIVNGHTTYFPGDILEFEGGVFVFAMQPTVEQHSTGHFSIQPQNTPTIRINLPALDDGENDGTIGAARVITVYHITKNQLHGRNGQLIRVWNAGN